MTSTSVMTMTDRQLAKLISDTLNQSGLTQRELAKLVGVSRVTVNRWLALECQPSPAIHRYLSKALIVLNVALAEEALPANMPAPHSKTVDDRWATISSVYKRIEAELPAEG
jgi:transcriptional regulator with XRE-family HTH domain